MLGIPGDALTWHEAPSDFPVARRPVYYVPCVKVDYKADESQIRLWLATIDNFIRQRRDRKGIIHAVSYARAKQIHAYSEFASSMIMHDRWDTREAVERFKQAGPGAILVSPSVTTGYDFPMQQCEWQIISKIPFPDRRSPVTAARTAHDPNYPAYIAMQELVQAVGRGMRSADDQCETAIFDENCGWFMRRNRDLAPSWFLAAYRKTETLPDPPPRLV
jgi:Rad3-related DNA helicase